jgi:Tfp pilus assembly protein PilX
MAYINADDHSIPWYGVDGTALQASATITSSTAGTAVEMGRGLFCVVITVTAIHQESGFDNVAFWIEANTKAATSTYAQIGAVCVGDATGVGVAIGTSGVGSFPIYVFNPYDNGIRVNAKVLGSTDSVTYSAKIYPLRGRVAP